MNFNFQEMKIVIQREFNEIFDHYPTDMHCLFNDERKTYDNGVSVMIGCCDPEGKPVYNSVTEMIIRAGD